MGGRFGRGTWCGLLALEGRRIARDLINKCSIPWFTTGGGGRERGK